MKERENKKKKNNCTLFTSQATDSRLSLTLLSSKFSFHSVLSSIFLNKSLTFECYWETSLGGISDLKISSGASKFFFPPHRNKTIYIYAQEPAHGQKVQSRSSTCQLSSLLHFIVQCANETVLLFDAASLCPFELISCPP